MLILTINGGSTSVRLAAFDVTDGQPGAAVLRERLTGEAAIAPAAFQSLMRRLPRSAAIAATAHRIVHGGTRFTRPVRIDAEVERAIGELAELAPLHNPVGLAWVVAAREFFGPEVLHVAAFDTAYFSTLPRRAGEYALPAALGTALGVRRHGFHGLAHEAMWRRWCTLHPHLERGGRIVTLQLGGGSSAAAIDRGRPVDTSMGFSPLEGLVMATRCGDVDPAVVPYVADRLGCSAADVIRRFNEESGLLGVSGSSRDVSQLVAQAAPASQFALELYCYRARKYLGAYLAALGGCDGIVFGGGVGEHEPAVRSAIVDGLQWLGVHLDERANQAATGGEASIGAARSRVAVHVIPGDEELLLANAAVSLLSPPAVSP